MNGVRTHNLVVLGTDCTGSCKSLPYNHNSPHIFLYGKHKYLKGTSHHA